MFSKRLLFVSVCVLLLRILFQPRELFIPNPEGRIRRMNFEVIGKIDGNFLIIKT